MAKIMHIEKPKQIIIWDGGSNKAAYFHTPINKTKTHTAQYVK